MKKSIFQSNAERLKILTHSLVCEVYEFLKQNEGCNVKYIYTTLKLDQSIVSNTLSKLKKHHFITYRTEGKRIFYKVNPEAIKRCLDEMIEDLMHTKHDL